MIYRVSNDEGRKKRYTSAYTLRDSDDVCEVCPKCGCNVERNLSSKSPMALIKDNYADFIPYYVSYKIVSARFKEIVDKEGLSGLTFRRAEIIPASELSESDKRELRNDGVPLKNVVQNPPEYYKIDVEYGAVYHEKSKLVVESHCDKCGRNIYVTEGYDSVVSDFPTVLDEKSLKDYDMFMTEGYGISNFCTERFYEVYKRYNLTGLLFTPIEVL